MVILGVSFFKGTILTIIAAGSVLFLFGLKEKEDKDLKQEDLSNYHVEIENKKAQQREAARRMNNLAKQHKEGRITTDEYLNTSKAMWY